MKTNLPYLWRASALLCAAVSVPLSASASFLDSDFWCRTYGCAVVHDGSGYDIYDNWIFAQNRCCVPFGSPMLSYYSNGFGDFNLTGTLGKHQGPNSNQGMILAVIDSGAGKISLQDDGDGFLDASDSFGGQFALNPNTDIALDGKGRQYSHSFFITSRNTKFSLRALASIKNSTQDFANTITLGDIKLESKISTRGNDQGFDYGARANTGNVMILNNVDDLGDMQGSPTRIMDFGRFSGVRQRNGDIDEQTIRLDFIYTMPQYDMSMGVGSLNVDMKFDFYREP